MLLAVRIWSYGCTWEVWRALKKLELHSAIASCNSYASFVLSKRPACIHNFRAEKRSAQASAHPLPQAQGLRGAFLCVDFVFVCCWSSE